MAWVIWFTILGMLPADNWNAPKEAVAISTVSFKVEPVAVASKVTDSRFSQFQPLRNQLG